jgi:hypothetical protein
VEGYVEHYKNVRLNSAIGYITPKDMLDGRQPEIHAERDRKLEAARKQRQILTSVPALVAGCMHLLVGRGFNPRFKTTTSMWFATSSVSGNPKK